MNPIMYIEMEKGGRIEIELFPELTNNSVRSIIWLANQGFYNNRIFYRIVKDFVLQTDCDKRPGIYETGCDYIIDGEYKAYFALRSADQCMSSFRVMPFMWDLQKEHPLSFKNPINQILIEMINNAVVYKKS